MKFNRAYLFGKKEKDMMRLGNMTPKRIAVHNTANYATARQEAQNMFNNNTKKGTAGVAVHYFVDENETYQLLEDNVHGWHAGDGGVGPGNKEAIAIEICRSLVYNTDQYARAELRAVELVKYLMKKHNIKIDKVQRHYDFAINKKRCPHRMFEGNPRTWNEFLGLVMEEAPKPTEPEKPQVPTGLYHDVGDKVNVDGVLHRDSNGANPGTRYKGLNTIQFVADGAKYPYHIYGLGWVAEADVRTFEKPKPAPTPKPQPGLKYNVGDKVKVNGKLHGNSMGAKPGRDYNGTNTIQFVAPKAPYPYHITNIGWVDAKAVGDDVKPVVKKEFVVLDKNVDRWGIYRLGVYPTSPNIFNYLRPKKFNGLKYEILGRPYANTVTIQTEQFGTVNIWIGPKTAHKIVRG